MNPPPLPLDKHMVWERKAVLRVHLSDNISCTVQMYAVPRTGVRGWPYENTTSKLLPSSEHPHKQQICKSRISTNMHAGSRIHRYMKHHKSKQNAAKVQGGKRDILLTAPSCIFSASVEAPGMGAGWGATREDQGNTQFSCRAEKSCLSQASFLIPQALKAILLLYSPDYKLVLTTGKYRMAGTP